MGRRIAADTTQPRVQPDDVTERLLARERELERLERELADRRQHGSADEVAALEFELADLRVRGVEGMPIDQVVGETMAHTARSNEAFGTLVALVGLVTTVLKVGRSLLVRKPRQ